jgi:hypothetical protein
MTTLPTYDSTLFEGAAWYYARYRPQYPPALFELLSEVFQLDGKGRLLDLGCGAGLIAINCNDEKKASYSDRTWKSRQPIRSPDHLVACCLIDYIP